MTIRTRSPDTEYQLLDEPLFGVEDEAGWQHRLTLPGLLARLSSGAHAEFGALQAHQQHAWHSFLVQLAALALVRSDSPESIQRSEEEWRALLVQAAEADGGGEEAFALVVPDLRRPAFLQPPIPSGELGELKSEHEAPSEELDVLITSKNHDVKVHTVTSPTPEHWVFALVMLQTMQGFLGAGNYGIARMNGGFSSRPCFSYSPDLGSAPRFVRDLTVLLGAREHLLEQVDRRKKLLGLTWCAPWDGTTSLALPSLDPFFIEICRRVRLVSRGERIVAYRGSSKAARIDGKEAHGNTGDPWTPVDVKEGASLTLPEAGFHYERVRDLLFGDWKLGAAGELRPADGKQPWLVAQALVRGQGKTGGYHERWLEVPAKATRFFLDREARKGLATRAMGWTGFVKDMRLKVLKPAVLSFLQGGPDKLDFRDERADPTVARLDARVDREFFRLLFEHADEASEGADAAFQGWLFDAAREELERAFTSLPTSSARRARGIASAERAFFGAAKKNLPLRKTAAGTEPQGEST